MKKSVVELTFPSELKEKPVLAQTIRQFNIVVNIVEASFSSEIGWALLSVEGEDGELEKVFNFWRSKHITIDIRKEE